MPTKHVHVFPPPGPEALPVRALYDLHATQRKRSAALINPAAERLVQEFILSHRVTACPPGYAVASPQYRNR